MGNLSGITASEARQIVGKALLDLIDEERELNIKIIALVKFNNSESFNGLNDDDKHLYKQQEKAMIEYSSALRKRIES